MSPDSTKELLARARSAATKEARKALAALKPSEDAKELKVQWSAMKEMLIKCDRVLVSSLALLVTKDEEIKTLRERIATLEVGTAQS